MIALLAGLLLSGAIAETVTFLILVPLAQAISTGQKTVARRLGPIDTAVSVTALVWVAALLLVVMTIIRLATTLVQTKFAAAIESTERRKLFAAFLAASWEQQSSEPVGRIQSIASFATARADRFTTQTSIARAGLNVSTMLLAALLIAPLGALTITTIGGLMYLAFRPLVSASRRASARYLKQSVQHDEDVAEMVAVSAEIRVFGAAQAFGKLLGTSHSIAVETKRRAAVLTGALMPIYQGIGLALAIAILGYASTRDVDVPALGIVVILLIRSLSYGQGLQGSYQKLAEFDAASSVLEDWHASYRIARQTSGVVPLGDVTELCLEGVTYCYRGGEEALSDVNLVVKPGDHIGIIGPSGAGKSTLAQILLRLRSPSSGTYVINGRLVDDYADLELRDKISLVPQQTVLFRGTVHDNIAFYRADVERTTVIDAAQRAGVHEAIMALPLAYDTLIGRAHRELSGGQTQRLGIARALLGRPSILVLDEPTSALDVDSEELITATLRALPNDVIVLVIAHRVSTLRDCNRVVVLEKGRIVADTSMSDAAITNQFFRRALEAGVFGQ